MASVTAIFGVDYANTITTANAEGTLAANAASGIIQLGKRRIFMVSVKDTTTPAAISQVSFTFGLSVLNGGTAASLAPAPVATSPFWSLSQGLVFDTGDHYDQIQLANFHNGADSIDYSVVLLDKY
jgi:hypothetical protein